MGKNLNYALQMTLVLVIAGLNQVSTAQASEVSFIEKEANFRESAKVSTSAADLLLQTEGLEKKAEPLETEELAQASETEETTSESHKLSILDEASSILNLLHKHPYAFGGVGSVTGDFSSRTQLSNDWGGARTAAADKGVFLGIYSTTTPQGIVSGGRNIRDDDAAVTQNLDLSLTLDTGRLNLWPAGLTQLSLQSRFGNDLNADAGTLLPTNFATEIPLSDSGDYVLLTEYYLLQALTPNLQAIIGKVNTYGVGDFNVFAGDYRHQFQNTGLVLNPMLGSYAPISTWTAALNWQPASNVNLSTSAIDPNGSAENFADDFFKDVTITQELTVSYNISDRPGNTRLGWALTTKDLPDVSDPFNFTRPGTDLLDFRANFNEVDNAVMFYLNFDQYLFTIESPASDSDEEETEFLSPRGLGLFGRFGIGPSNQNLIDLFGSFGLGAKGIIAGREYDEFGVGWYYAGISSDFNDFISTRPVLSNLLPDGLKSENGIEAFYNFAVTPALQLTFNGQYIFNPVLTLEDEVFILGGRLQINL